MDFFENVKNVVTDTAHTVAKKSGELYEASKIQYTIFDLNNDVKKLYTEIGKLTYKMTVSGDDCADEIKMKCDIVAAKLAKINSLKNGEIDFALKCHSCGRPTDGENNYCPSCGVKMTVDAKVDVDGE